LLPTAANRGSRHLIGAGPPATWRSSAFIAGVDFCAANQRPYTPIAGSKLFFAGSIQSIFARRLAPKTLDRPERRAWTSVSCSCRGMYGVASRLNHVDRHARACPPGRAGVRLFSVQLSVEAARLIFRPGKTRNIGQTESIPLIRQQVTQGPARAVACANRSRPATKRGACGGPPTMRMLSLKGGRPARGPARDAGIDQLALHRVESRDQDWPNPDWEDSPFPQSVFGAAGWPRIKPGLANEPQSGRDRLPVLEVQRIANCFRRRMSPG